MNIPYYVLLIIYSVILFSLGIFFLLNLYHVVRFGFFNFSVKLNLVLISGTVVAIIAITFILLAGTDWIAPIELFSSNYDDSFFRL